MSGNAYVARLVAARPARAGAQLARPARAAKSNAPDADFAEVDIASLQLAHPRSVGVEAAGLDAIGWLGIDPILMEPGFNGIQRAAVAGSLIGRMAAPGSELATWRWLTERSALGELLGVNFDTMSPMQLYRASDFLVKHRDAIEDALFGRIQDLFGLPVTVTLYDLTNTYFDVSVRSAACSARSEDVGNSWLSGQRLVAPGRRAIAFEFLGVRTASPAPDFWASGRVRGDRTPSPGRKFVCRVPNAIPLPRAGGWVVKCSDIRVR